MMLAATFVLIFLTRRLGVSMLAIAGLVLALRGISMIKSRYIGAPLLAPDLFYFGNGDTLEVIAHYPKIWHGVMKKGLAAVVILSLCWMLESAFWRNWRRPRRWSLQLLGVMFSVAAFFAMIAPGGPFKHVLAKNDWEVLNPGSPLTSFLLSLHRMHVIIPELDPAAADHAAWVSTQAPEHPTPHPDIVVVLEESTFDPRTLAVCTIPQCSAGMFEADAQTTAHGALRVHTFGGGTWNSEFSLFTGLPQTLFGPGGNYAPYNLAPRTRFTLPKLLKTPRLSHDRRLSDARQFRQRTQGLCLVRLR
jgi:phosphoglycerol transferase MdoB-like AlkP superfamily enzyme